MDHVTVCVVPPSVRHESPGTTPGQQHPSNEQQSNSQTIKSDLVEHVEECYTAESTPPLLVQSTTPPQTDDTTTLKHIKCEPVECVIVDDNPVPVALQVSKQLLRQQNTTILQQQINYQQLKQVQTGVLHQLEKHLQQQSAEMYLLQQQSEAIYLQQHKESFLFQRQQRHLLFQQQPLETVPPFFTPQHKVTPAPSQHPKEQTPHSNSGPPYPRNKGKCSVCNTFFTRKTDLKRHFGTHVHKHNYIEKLLAAHGSVATTQVIATAAESIHTPHLSPQPSGNTDHRLELIPAIPPMVVPPILDTNIALDLSKKRLLETEEVHPSPLEDQGTPRQSYPSSGEPASQSDTSSPLPAGVRGASRPTPKSPVQYKCEECDKVFSKAGYFIYHNKSYHSNPKPFKCLICGERFPHHLSYQQHLRKHAQDKRFKCEICPSQKTDHKTHNLCSHAGEGKRFGCELCGKRFTRRQNMFKHVEKHQRHVD